VPIGDTYVWCPPGTVIDHLWIVISDATQHGDKCVVINLTESSHGPHSFTLVPGQHRYIYKDSDVNFGDAFLTSETHLAAETACGSAIPHDAMDDSIVAEIIRRARVPHPAFPRHLTKFLPR
jgi:hypothetical protein